MRRARALLLATLACVASHVHADSEINVDGSVLPTRTNVSILVLSGSLRRLSSNSAIARAAVACSPFMVMAPRLDSLPFFDADIEVPLPESVAVLRKLAFGADAFWFSTPEYNSATSAVLKNAVDWLSRGGPENVSPLKGKPFTIASAGGGSGGMRAQVNVKAIVQDSGMVHVGSTSRLPPLAIKLWDGTQRFSPETGDLVDPPTLTHVQSLVSELIDAAKSARRRDD